MKRPEAARAADVTAGGLDPDEAAARLGAIAIEAGRFLAAVADRGAGRTRKADGSPATAADLASEALILRRLAEAFPGLPVVAEESAGAGAPGPAFFLVDPLDGTRDFLAGSDEWAVAIALVVESRPVAAAIAAPGLGRAWRAGRAAEATTLGGGEPAWRPARVRRRPEGGPIALVSRRHGDAATEACLQAIGLGERRTVSSAAKFGLLASGEADLYVRCGPTMEWDAAAGDHLVHAAGGATVGPDGAPPVYGRPPFRNGPFAAFGDRALGPELAGPFAEACATRDR